MLATFSTGRMLPGIESGTETVNRSSLLSTWAEEIFLCRSGVFSALLEIEYN
ncbi:hypothetical protein SOV_20950 [Sporomusa ovata DSM 2662]|nr:hypothetical protein SOV_4c00740 [Sporomusa ovata DSM 2662]